MKLKVLILLFVPFMLAACRDDDNPRSRPNFVETSFTDISGELTNDYGEEVLTDRNTLYGISVRLDNLHTYSYGLFDDLSKAVVRRDANQEYWFKLTVVPNGKTLCTQDEQGNYGDLFTIYDDGKLQNCPLSNTFIYCDTTIARNGFQEDIQPRKSYPYDIYVDMDRVFNTATEQRFVCYKYNGHIRFFAYNLSQGRFEIHMNEMDKQFFLTPEKRECILPFTLLNRFPFPTAMCRDYASEATFQVRYIDEERQIDRWMNKSVIVHRDEQNIFLLDVNEFTN